MKFWDLCNKESNVFSVHAIYYILLRKEYYFTTRGKNAHFTNYHLFFWVKKKKIRNIFGGVRIYVRQLYTLLLLLHREPCKYFLNIARIERTNLEQENA